MSIRNKLSELLIRSGQNLQERAWHNELKSLYPELAEYNTPRELQNALVDYILSLWHDRLASPHFSIEELREEISASRIFEKLKIVAKSQRPGYYPTSFSECFSPVTFEPNRHRMHQGRRYVSGEKVVILVPEFRSVGGDLPREFRAVALPAHILTATLTGPHLSDQPPTR